MRISFALIAAASVATSFASHAALIDESAVETTTSLLLLPKSAPETISVRACGGCTAKQLRLSEATQLFVGKSAVTLPVLRDVALNNSTWAYVYYDAKTNQITRIRVDAELPTAAKQPAEKRRGK